MQQDSEVMHVEFMIKIEPEEFESTVSVEQPTEQNRNLVNNENVAETEAIYIKVEEADRLNDVPIVKLEPQG